LTRRSDKVAQLRRQLPWVKVDREYVFEAPDGRQTLADLFDGRHQLLVQHFMLSPGAEQGCPSCSYMADHTDGMIPHLAHRDVTFVAISRAPFDEIERFRQRMGWRFKWLSSHGNSFTSASASRRKKWPRASFSTTTARGHMRSRNGRESACSERTKRAMSFTPIQPMDVAWK
jgi:predicted dithiol-disulfide oxidoreductase (DUF899 family)